MRLLGSRVRPDRAVFVYEINEEAFGNGAGGRIRTDKPRLQFHQQSTDGRVPYELKNRWSDGSTHLVFAGLTCSLWPFRRVVSSIRPVYEYGLRDVFQRPIRRCYI